MNIPSSYLANMILDKSFKTKHYINCMKLQKMMYLVAREYKRTHKADLISEDFLAWEYGPVLQSVHDYHKIIGADNIRMFMKVYGGVSFKESSKEVVSIMEKVWNETQKLKNNQIAELSKDEHWEAAYKANEKYVKI